MPEVKRIAITGPESTGKSWLSEQLASHFQTVWVPEYAREYLATLDRPYEEPDILTIAKGQLEREEKMAGQARRLLICDTDLLVTRIWSEVKFGRCDPWILHTMETHVYDLYLLCAIDLPWEEDPLREHPHLRQHLFELYSNELTKRNWTFRVIDGLGEQRLNHAINIIEQSFHF